MLVVIGLHFTEDLVVIESRVSIAAPGVYGVASTSCARLLNRLTKPKVGISILDSQLYQ
jgi:hypothetical protein